MKKRMIALALCLALCLAGCGQAPAAPGSGTEGLEKYSVYWFDVFDTVTQVTGYAESQEAWDEQMAALHADLVRYHQLYDIYNTYDGLNNLATVNAAAGQAPVQVDSAILDMLEMALYAYDVTDGKMNITCGSMLRVWHNYRTAGLAEPEQAQLPPMEELETAMQHGTPQDVVLDREAGTVFLRDADMLLDVGSVGKGYAVEQAARAAEARGLSSALISVGGNLRSIGKKPDGSAWTGGVQNPWADHYQGQQYLCAVQIVDGALVTSGDYQRYYEVDGERYHHLIDTETLMPASHFDAVAVYCADSGWADCLSTGLFCMGLAQGQELVAGLEGVEAMWMLQDGSIVYSDGFKQDIRD